MALIVIADLPLPPERRLPHVQSFAFVLDENGGDRECLILPGVEAKLNSD